MLIIYVLTAISFSFLTFLVLNNILVVIKKYRDNNFKFGIWAILVINIINLFLMKKYSGYCNFVQSMYKNSFFDLRATCELTANKILRLESDEHVIDDKDVLGEIVFITIIATLVFLTLLLALKNMSSAAKKKKFCSYFEPCIPNFCLIAFIIQGIVTKQINLFFLIVGLTSIPILLKLKFFASNNKSDLSPFACTIWFNLFFGWIYIISFELFLLVLIIFATGISAIALKLMGGSFSGTIPNGGYENNTQSNSTDNGEEKPWIASRGYVKDDDDNEYKVGRSGDYVRGDDGEWKRVHHNGDDDYFDDENGRHFLH